MTTDIFLEKIGIFVLSNIYDEEIDVFDIF